MRFDTFWQFSSNLGLGLIGTDMLVVWDLLFLSVLCRCILAELDIVT
jgi:hypothetical protein